MVTPLKLLTAESILPLPSVGTDMKIGAKASMTNAGQLSLGSSRPESSRPGHFDLILYSLLFSINDDSTVLDGMCFIKMFNRSLRK